MKKPEALIAESDPQAVLTCERALMQSGYDVRTAGCGMTAAAQIRARRPDVVILGEDLQWGGIESVLELIESLGNDPDEPGYAPHLLILGRSSAFQLSRDFGLPINQCLEMPLTRWSVMNAVSWAITRPSQELARV